jgi:hypothetical protein
LFSQSKLSQYLLGTLALFVIIYSAWSLWPKTDIKIGVLEKAPEAGVAKKITKEEITPKKVVIYKKDDAAKVLPIPPAIAKDPAKQITATADIKPTPNGVTAVTIFDTNTGVSEIFVEQKKAPWFAFQDTNRVGVSYGIKTNGATEVGIHYERDVLRIKDLYLSGRVEVNSELGKDLGVDGKAKVQLQYRW